MAFRDAVDLVKCLASANAHLLVATEYSQDIDAVC